MLYQLYPNLCFLFTHHALIVTSSAPSWELLRSLGEDHPLSVPSEMPHCSSASDERRETQGIRYKLRKVIVTMMWKLISKNVDTSQHFSILYIYIYISMIYIDKVNINKLSMVLGFYPMDVLR